MTPESGCQLEGIFFNLLAPHIFSPGYPLTLQASEVSQTGTSSESRSGLGPWPEDILMLSPDAAAIIKAYLSLLPLTTSLYKLKKDITPSQSSSVSNTTTPIEVEAMRVSERIRASAASFLHQHGYCEGVELSRWALFLSLDMHHMNRTLSLSLFLSHTLTHSLSFSQTNTLTHSLSHSFTLSYSSALSLSHTLSPCYPLLLFLSLSLQHTVLWALSA